VPTTGGAANGPLRSERAGLGIREEGAGDQRGLCEGFTGRRIAPYLAVRFVHTEVEHRAVHLRAAVRHRLGDTKRARLAALTVQRGEGDDAGRLSRYARNFAPAAQVAHRWRAAATAATTHAIEPEHLDAHPVDTGERAVEGDDAGDVFARPFGFARSEVGCYEAAHGVGDDSHARRGEAV